MQTFSTRQVAKQLGITPATLSRYMSLGKIPSPKIVEVGSSRLHAWTEPDIERARKLLPKIKNGRKLRYRKPQKE